MLTLFNRSIKISFLGLSVYIILLTLLCSLGFWQLDRADQKRQWLAQQQAMLDLVAVDLNREALEEIDEVHYRKVVARGRYDGEHQFLLDNQIVGGKSGYFVLTPLVMDKQYTAVLVNRGWVPLGQDRSVLPDVKIESKSALVTGRINHFPGVGFKLEGAEIPTEGWPAVVQVLDAGVLSARLGYPLNAYQIELDSSASDGFVRDWKIATPIPPEKHIAYAVQWFGLALTLTALFIWMSARKKT